MQSIKKQNDKIDIAQINSFDHEEFCNKKINKIDKKCINFYKKLFNENLSGFTVCPFGFSCYGSEKCKEIKFSSFLCELSDLKLIKNRDKYNKNNRKREILDSSMIKKKLDLYAQYYFYSSICDDICHDLNNALNQLSGVEDALSLKEDEKKFLQLYKNIINEVKILNEYSIINEFDKDKEYYPSTIKGRIENLINLLKGSCDLAEKYIRNNSIDAESTFCLWLSGFSMLYTLLMQNLYLDNSFNFKEEIKTFSLHKMVKKIVLLSRHKASLKNVSFPVFEGNSFSNIVNYPKKVFTILFTIIDNAVKYCKENELIQIYLKESGDQITIQVLNSCMPLGEEDIAHIHEKGYRGKNRSEKGKGFGLNVVQRLCNDCNIENRASYANGYFSYTLKIKL